MAEQNTNPYAKWAKKQSQQDEAGTNPYAKWAPTSEENKAGVTRSIADSIVELGTSVLGLPGDISKFISGKDPALLPTSDQLEAALAEFSYDNKAGISPAASGFPNIFSGSVHSGADIPGVGMEGRTDLGRIAKAGADVASMAAVGASVPLAFAKGVKTTGPQATSTVGRIVQDVVEGAARNPRASQATETMSGLGAGIGAAAAEAVDPGDATSQTIGAVAGGLAPATFAPTILKYGGKGINKITSIFSKTGQENRAADIARHMVESQGGNVDDVIRVLNYAEDVGESAALKSGDEGLLRLESWIRQMDPDVEKGLSEMNRQAVDEMSGLIERLARTGDPQALRMAAKLRASAYDDAVKRTLDAARKKAAAASGPLRADDSAEDISEAADSVLDAAFKRLKGVEDAKWAEVPSDAPVVGVNIGRAWKDLKADTEPELLPDLIKPNIQKLLTRYRQNPNMEAGKLKKLRSYLLTEARSASSGANADYNAARVYNDLADAVMDDMAGLPGYDSARAFTRAFRNGYDQTFAGAARRTGVGGARSMAPEEVLPKAMGGGGASANRRMSELESAAAMAGDDLATSMKAEQERFLTSFAERFVKGDGTIKDGATEFLRKNRKLLSRFPELRDTLTNAQSRTKILMNVKAQVSARNAVLKKSAISEVLGVEDPASAVGAVITGKNPQRGFRELANTAKRAGDDAVEGLKTAAMENVIGRSSSFQVLSDNMGDVIRIMTKNGVMDAGEASRFRNLLKRASTLEANMSKASGRAGDIGDGPEGAELLDTMIRSQGAKFGAFLAGHTTGAQLVAAGKGSLLFRKILAKNPFNKTVHILQHAAQNPKVMADLLAKHRSPALEEQALTRIRASLVAAGLAPDDDQPQQ